MHALLLGALLMASPQDTSRWAPLARVIDSAIAHRAFPGAVVAIGRHDTVLYRHAFGHLDYQHGRRATLRTVYDIASLTKVVGLTFAMMQLVEEGLVGLETPAVRYVPAFHDSTITVRQLLTHTSGLPAFKQWWPRVHSRADMLALVNAEPLEQPPGTKTVYSDIGAMVMMEIVENVTGERLDRYLQIHLFGPLGMRDTRYLPPKSWLPRIAPTELDTTYRHRMVRGEVHDENAFSMGGISGHAGLFSTAPDLARFAQFLLRGGTSERARGHEGGTTRLLDSATIAMFTRVQRPGFSSRALGWDTPSENSSAGTKLSSRAFGHTGFTGTSIWVDPAQDLFIILLTNRVHPTRENTQILGVRRAVADAAVEALASGPH
jgi:CubicO group peptidase (beta-lactamase class C family)